MTPSPPRRASSCLALAAIALLGCGGPRTGAAGPSASASPSAVAPASAACPAVDVDAVAPKVVTRSGRTVAIADLYPHTPARASGELPSAIHLGNIVPVATRQNPVIASYPIPGPAFSRAWVEGGVRASVRPAFDAWMAAFELHATNERVERILERRLWSYGGARSKEGRDASPEEVCAQADWSRAHDALYASTEEMRRLRTALADALGALPDLTAEERVVQAELMLIAVDRESVDVRRTRAGAVSLLLAVAHDHAATPALRAAAASRALDVPDLSEPNRADAARSVVELAREPRWVVPAGFHLARAISGLRDRLTALRDLASRSDGDAALAQDRGRIFVEIGSAERALEEDAAELRAWTDCLAASVEDDDSAHDPFGCVTELGRAVVRSGGSDDRTLTVPIELAPAVGVAIASVAGFARDRAGATQAAEAALALDPGAREGPLLLTILAELAPNAATRRALLDRRARDYGSDTPWFARELRHALTVGAIATPLGPLFTAPQGLSPAPTNEDGWRVDLATRARTLTLGCGDLLYETSELVTVRVDTTTTPPTFGVTSSTPAPDAVRCVERAARAWFRSVPPVVVTWTVLR